MSDETKSELPTFTAGEKQVLKDLFMRWMHFLFASGKWQGLVRHVLTMTGAGAFFKVDDVNSKASAIALIVASAGWSWLEKHYADKPATPAPASTLPAVSEIKPQGETKP